MNDQKGTKETDERIVAQKRKIKSDAYQILMLCLLVAMLVKQYLLKAPPSVLALDLLCVIGIAIYVAIHNISLGIDLWHVQSVKKLVLQSIGIGVVWIVLFSVLAGERDLFALGFGFVCFAATFVAFRLFLSRKAGKKQEQINAQLDAQEQEEE